MLRKSGRKDLTRALVYVHLDDAGGFFARGLHRPQVSTLEPIRRGMVDHAKEFAALLRKLRKAGLELDDSEATKTMPRGFSDLAEHPHVPWIRLKNLMVTLPLSRRDWTSGSIAERLADFTVSITPLLNFLDAHA